MRVLGIDLALGTTGICYPEGSTDVVQWGGNGVDRLHRIEVGTNLLLDQARPDVVAIEGYSFNSQHTAAHSTGEAGGVVKLTIYKRNVPIMLFPPAVLKKFATGSGRANKSQVVSAAVLRARRTFDHDDEADAWWLWAMAHETLDDPVVDLPKAQRAAVDNYRRRTEASTP